MLDKRVADLLNDQINKEMYSAYLYLDFANFYIHKGLDGYANWYHVQAKEEIDHTMGIVNYLHNHDYEITLNMIDKPDKRLDKLEDPLYYGLEHERYVTDLIDKIYDTAYQVKDYRTMKFLDWYINEQGEEEKNASDLITQFELFGHDPKALYSLNNELKQRTYIQSQIGINE